MQEDLKSDTYWQTGNLEAQENTLNKWA